MLTIKMDNKAMYQFADSEYTDYTITEDYVVVRDEEQWIGVFDRTHFVSLVCESEETE